MDIEEVAHKTPEKILTFSVDPATGIMPHHGRRVAQALKLTGDVAKQIETILPKLYSAFTTKDMSLSRSTLWLSRKTTSSSVSMRRWASMATRFTVTQISSRCAI